MKTNENVTRKRVYEFYIKNRDQGKKFTVDHFLLEKIPKSTTYSIIRRAANDSGHERAPGSGRIAKKMPSNKVNQLKKAFNNSQKVSLRSAARKYHISPSYNHYLLKNKSNIRKRSKIAIPKRSERQQSLAQTKCSRLYSKFYDFQWILDDESYFTLSNSTSSGNDIFYTDDINKCPSDVKFKKMSKFEQKVLVWIAISPIGKSAPYIIESRLAINQHIYLDECIKKRLIPFVDKHQDKGKIVFWPDLASSHYAKKVQEYLKEKEINFVAKVDNPANVPEIRPIEFFWSILKREVYKDGWEAENTKKLISRINYCLTKIDLELIQRLCMSVRSKIDTVRRYGVIETR